MGSHLHLCDVVARGTAGKRGDLFSSRVLCFKQQDMVMDTDVLVCHIDLDLSYRFIDLTVFATI